MWCGISKLCIVAPYFSEDEEGVITVNSTCSVHLLKNYLLTELQRRQVNVVEL